MPASPANDNRRELIPHIDQAVPGQALTVRDPRRKFHRTYSEFVRHVGDGRHVLVRKLISSMYRARWTNPLKVERAAIVAVHNIMAR